VYIALKISASERLSSRAAKSDNIMKCEKQETESMSMTAEMIE
jgi:hypothetical protein